MLKCAHVCRQTMGSISWEQSTLSNTLYKLSGQLPVEQIVNERPSESCMQVEWRASQRVANGKTPVPQESLVKQTS